jgi:hypothetical protein
MGNPANNQGISCTADISLAKRRQVAFGQAICHESLRPKLIDAVPAVGFEEGTGCMADCAGGKSGIFARIEGSRNLRASWAAPGEVEFRKPGHMTEIPGLRK